MSKPKGYPHKQGFCVTPKRNQAKRNAWWQRGNTNNRVDKSNKSQ